MTQDAKFEDGVEKPLRLKAEDIEDLQVISAVLQDAVLPMTEVQWQSKERRFALLANRFRWEDADKAARQQRNFERVQSVVLFDSVLKVASSGVNLGDKDQVISLLSVQFELSEAPAGRIVLTLAGDGAIALDVECVDVTLTDVTRPYRAPSGSQPQHP